MPPLADLDVRAAPAKNFVDIVTEAVVGAPPARPADELVFFKVVNAWPERRFTALPGHVARAATNVSLSSFDKVACEDGEFLLQPSLKPVLIDIRRFFRSIFSMLHRWQPKDPECHLQWHPGALSRVHRSMSSLALPLQESGVPDEEEQALQAWENPRESAVQVAEWMLKQGAVAHQGKHISQYDLSMAAPDHSIADVNELVGQGILESREDGFGDCMYAISAKALSWQGHTRATHVELDVTRPFDAEWGHCCKLELLVALLQKGWKASPHIALLPFRVDSAKEFLASGIKGSRWYFVALLQAGLIFEKGISCVVHDMPGSYYQLLCEGDAEQLRQLPPMENIRRCAHRHFLALLKRQPLPELLEQDAFPLPEDGGPDQEAEVPQDGAIAVAPEPSEAHPVLEGPSLAVPAGFTVDVRHRPDAPLCRVRYDNATHASGIQRAYIGCPWGHPDCWKYRQTNLTPDKDEMIAYLYCWALQGEGRSKEEHRDQVVPSSADVRKMMWALARRG